MGELILGAFNAVAGLLKNWFGARQQRQQAAEDAAALAAEIGDFHSICPTDRAGIRAWDAVRCYTPQYDFLAREHRLGGLGSALCRETVGCYAKVNQAVDSIKAVQDEVNMQRDPRNGLSFEERKRRDPDYNSKLANALGACQDARVSIEGILPRLDAKAGKAAAPVETSSRR